MLQTLKVHTPAECSKHNMFPSSCNNSPSKLYDLHS